jgi:ATP-dependent Lhr-like helicase
MAGMAAEPHDFGVTVPATTLNDGRALVSKLATLDNIDPADVAAFVENIGVGKFAEYVPEPLARTLWARQNADVVKTVPAMARGMSELTY